MGIIIKRSVRVKIVVTGQYKLRRTAEMRVAVARLDEVGKRIDIQLGSAVGRGGPGLDAANPVTERLRAEKRKTEEARIALMSELEKIPALEVGAEYDLGALDGEVEVNVGDDFSRVSACEIVVKDDKIVEIRHGICPENNRI